MRKVCIVIAVVWVALAAVRPAWAQEDERLFERARLLIFDKKWQSALDPLQRIVDTFRSGRFAADAQFYIGKCQEELGATRRALAAYEEYLRIAPHGGLREEAEVAIIDQAYNLFQAGEADALSRIVSRLGHALRAVRYYAAFTLSYVPDRKRAAPALPVLKEIIARERDDDLRDRARIALMRIDPGQLPRAAAPAAATGRLLHIRIQEPGRKEASVSLSIPLALADLALKALSDRDRQALRQKGYDVETILRQLSARSGLVIEAGDEGTRIRIWID